MNLGPDDPNIWGHAYLDKDGNEAFFEKSPQPYLAVINARACIDGDLALNIKKWPLLKKEIHFKLKYFGLRDPWDKTDTRVIESNVVVIKREQ